MVRAKFMMARREVGEEILMGRGWGEAGRK